MVKEIPNSLALLTLVSSRVITTRPLEVICGENVMACLGQTFSLQMVLPDPFCSQYCFCYFISFGAKCGVKIHRLQPNIHLQYKRKLAWARLEFTATTWARGSWVNVQRRNADQLGQGKCVFNNFWINEEKVKLLTLHTQTKTLPFHSAILITPWEREFHFILALILHFYISVADLGLHRREETWKSHKYIINF